MPLHLRRRGEIWYVRGSVRVGRETVTVPEFSTGSHSRADAQAIAAAEEARIRSERLDGPAGRQKRLTVDDCLATYLRRPGGVKAHDGDRVRDFSDRIGGRPIAEAVEAWHEWLRTRGARMAPATAARWRAILQAALNEGCTKLNAGVAPKLPTVRDQAPDRVVYLTDGERKRLLAAYSKWAAPVMLVLAYQGLRTQEALQLDWRAVSLHRATLHVVRSKSGKGRVVPLHPRVQEMLAKLWVTRDRPESGPIFYSKRREPYRDTRELGGNPLAKAHATACKKAGITGFRVHDWRHDFAVRFLQEGGDVRLLMQICGWSTMRMVERYVTFRTEHLAAVLHRIA
jgi:integrase